MGIRNWLRPKTRVVDNHKLASSYSFFFGSPERGKASDGTHRRCK